LAAAAQQLTAAILVAKVGKPPHVGQVDGESHSGQHELYLTVQTITSGQFRSSLQRSSDRLLQDSSDRHFKGSSDRYFRTVQIVHFRAVQTVTSGQFRPSLQGSLDRHFRAVQTCHFRARNLMTLGNSGALQRFIRQLPVWVTRVSGTGLHCPLQYAYASSLLPRQPLPQQQLLDLASFPFWPWQQQRPNQQHCGGGRAAGRQQRTARKYVCSACGMAFSRSNTLATHRPTPARHNFPQLIHSGEKPHACPTCGRAFRQAANLKRHQAIHLQAKSHQCPACDKGFNRLCNLRLHIRSVHCQLLPRCDQCNRPCANAKELRLHAMSEHGRDL
uniref:Protein krueppel n=1 Tax=Macrostomum lignano TaxID=282301 RepID=A0A1I8GJN2_9PLAT